MKFLKSIYQSIISTMANKSKTIEIKKPKDGLPKDAKGWAEFAKKNKVTATFFKIDHTGITYRTSDGKAYSSIQEFAVDGGNWDKIQTVKVKK